MNLRSRVFEISFGDQGFYINDIIQKVAAIEGKFLPIVQKELSITANRMKTCGIAIKPYG